MIDVRAFVVNLLFSTCGDFEMEEHQSKPCSVTWLNLYVLIMR